MKIKAFALMACAAISLAACDTYTAQQYQTTPQNTIVIQQLASTGARASVGDVRLAEGIEARPTCRLAGPLDLGGGDDLANTIKQAIQGELLAGGMFRVNATPINITVTELKPDSFNGSWTIGLQAYSRKSSGYAIQSTTGFSTSFSAVSACNNTATAFNRALSDAIQKLVKDTRFKSLL
ncbi:hypothetical protein [Thioclava sp. JE_KL1]|uniref:hypothetical protein n=1 Tax=Thioclava sp. JE_KL1 TaxID=2651187 RepID=UPI00128B2D3D|nr:hypothetical protein [Thioclava sp. JE_KL1]MPQ95274.1 hypothetical protein [Thioclava sp. JE_KL1]